MINVDERASVVRPALDSWAVLRVALVVVWIGLLVATTLWGRPSGEQPVGVVSLLVFDRAVPTGMFWLAVAAFVAPVACLVSGPEPWRATRWAWFWLWVNPLGGLAFLVLSGPFPGVPPTRDPARRLTGGWAFLIGGVVGSGVGLVLPW